ncbi:hypothetical protein [Dongia sp.]|uniref:hypothetical protein n=1 Tax=Dongia sp. TaxID=1977262 RepID=UPI0035AF0015
MTPAEELAEKRVQRLIDRLPNWMARLLRRVREPSARWVRIPIAVFCLMGGMLFFLPVLGIWMLPLGVLLLVEDLPIMRRGVYATVNWVAHRHPHWFS